MAFRYLLVAVLAYLLGCCNGAIITSKLFFKEDVRSHGSGNAGLTNFQRSYGGWLTLVVIGVDVVKAVLACLLGRWLVGSTTAMMLGGLCVIVGHMFPVFFGFRGGKGILSGAAVAATMDWRILLMILVVFLIAVVLTRYVSLGSCLAAAVFPFGFLWRFWGDWVTVAMAAVVAAGAIFMHRANIARLVQGTERKLSFHSKR